jgi:hypothetical protein
VSREAPAETRCKEAQVLPTDIDISLHCYHVGHRCARKYAACGRGGNEMSRMIIAVLLSLTALGPSACQGNRLQGTRLAREF